MAKATKATKSPGPVREPQAAAAAPPQTVTLTAAMSKTSMWQRFNVWLVFDSPLITHAWSEKAKREMLAKMVRAVQEAKPERNPQQEFVNSLYQIKDGVYGFPVTAVKKAILSYAHKDKGIAKTNVKAALWLDYTMISVRPALAGAICNMPLIRLYAPAPQMREDMVRIKGRGGTTANFAYRAQFFPCAIKLSGKLDPEVLPPENLAFRDRSSSDANRPGAWRTAAHRGCDCGGAATQPSAASASDLGRRGGLAQAATARDAHDHPHRADHPHRPRRAAAPRVAQYQ
jgi:hypothetical protein